MQKLFPFCLLLAAWIAVSSAQSCPDEWTNFGNSCYRYFAEKENFEGALLQCEGADSDLVTIDSEEENMHVYNLAQGKAFWIGLSRQGGSQFIWETGMEYQQDCRDWIRYEPTTIKLQDCVVMAMVGKTSTDKQRWKNINCNSKRFFVCEKEL